MTTDRAIRAEVYFSGDVQGVGFRFTTRAIAEKFDVRGYVRNLPDGRVEVVVEGTKPEIDAFLGEVAGRMGGYIQDQSREDGQAAGEFSSFEIRH